MSIKEISIWDMPNMYSKPDGYEYKAVPESTSENIAVLIEKINELVTEINKLKGVSE